MIEFEDFQKVEIKIGTVLEAEKVENADKLIKMQVEFGEEKRQIVSGIAMWYAPEDLVGKQMPFVVNLEPRTIRGVESQGMILAAHGEDNSAVVMHPDKKVESGSIVG